jgi:hypothetical protein
MGGDFGVSDGGLDSGGLGGTKELREIKGDLGDWGGVGRSFGEGREEAVRADDSSLGWCGVDLSGSA